MNKKIFLILIIIIILLLVGVVLLSLNMTKKISPIIPVPVNQPQAEVSPATPAEISYLTLFTLLKLYSICDYDVNKKSLVDSCSQAMTNKSKRDICVSEIGYPAMLYYLKKNDKEKFMAVCNEYKILRPKITDCQASWDILTDKNIEFCDSPDKACQVLVTEADKNSCPAKFDLTTAKVEQLSATCKREILLRRAQSDSDCLKIEDDFTRLLCFQTYKTVCSDVAEIFDSEHKTLDPAGIQNFLHDYPMQNCCYFDDAEQSLKFLIRNLPIIYTYTFTE
jgi:hypothetical protein